MRGAAQQFAMLVAANLFAAFFNNTAHIFLPSRYNLPKIELVLS
jgi:hypothetical protein